MRVCLLLPAGGSGLRFGGPKQVHAIAGHPLIWWSLRPFMGLVDEVVCACHPEIEKAIADAIGPLCEEHATTLVLVPGGDSRQDSVYQALKSSNPHHEYVLVHDAARPLITEDLIKRVIESLSTHPASVAALPCRETVKRGSAESAVLETVSRDDLWLAQTPQAFHRQAGLDAFQQAAEDGWQTTDDVAVLARAGHHVQLVEGESRNIKITTPDDLILAEALLSIS